MEYHMFTPGELIARILDAIETRAVHFEAERALEDRKGAASQNKIMLYQFGVAELNSLAGAIRTMGLGEMRDEAPTEAELVPPETTDPIMERELEEIQEIADGIHSEAKPVRRAHR